MEYLYYYSVHTTVGEKKSKVRKICHNTQSQISTKMNLSAVDVEETRKRANLRVLQRIDKQIIDTIGVATHVVLYEFRTAENQWDKCNMEGSLFVTKRSEAPRFKLVVLNRNSTHNLEVPIRASFQVQLREPYIIFRDAEAPIRGLWFHDDEERNKMSELLQKVKRSISHVAELEKKADPNISYAQKVNATKKIPKPQPEKENGTSTNSMNTQDAAAALMGALSITPQSSTSPSPHIPMAQSLQQAMINSNPVPPVEQPRIPPAIPNHKTIVFDRKSLQLSLLSLIQDDRFLDLIHAQYLKVAHARANREQQQQQQQLNQQHQQQQQQQNYHFSSQPQQPPPN